MARTLAPLRAATVQALVPASRTGRLLALTAAVDALGTGMYLTSAALYFTRVVGLRAGQVGLGLTVAGLVGLVGAVPVGTVADRAGSGRVFIAVQAVRGAGFLAYCTVRSFPAFLAVTCALGVLETVTPPLTVAVVGAAVPPGERVQTLARLRAVRNVGFGLGALVATAAIAAGSRAGFVALIAADAASYFIAAACLGRIGIWSVGRPIGSPGSPASRPPKSPGGGPPGPRYLGAAALNGVLSIHMTLLTLGLPLWIALRTRAPLAMAGVVVTANTALTVALQARLARRASTLAGAAESMFLAGASLSLCCALALLAARARSPALAAALVGASAVPLTLGELWQSAGEWTVSYDLADPARRARDLSAFQLGSAGQQVAGPLVVTALILPHAAGWAALGALTFAAGAAFHPLLARPGTHTQKGDGHA